MKPHLFVIGGGVEACEGLKAIQHLGWPLIVADGNPDAPGFAYAARRVVVSTYDAVGMTHAALELLDQGVAIAGALAMCADVPVTVAHLTSALGLPGLPLAVAHRLADKLLMKRALQAAGVPIPAFAAVPGAQDLDAIAAELGLPMVIKPVDSRGARGVQRIDDPTQLQAAFESAARESPTGRVMAEAYLAGPQISTETLIDDGRCYTLGFADRNYEWLEQTRPFMVENGGDAPSSLTPDQQRAVIDTVEHAARSLGILRGVAKGDMVLTASGPKVIEIAGRLSGGYFATNQIPLATGVPFVEQAVRLAVGEALDPAVCTPSATQAVAIRYLSLARGTVAAVRGIDLARAMPGVALLQVFVQPGSVIGGLANHTQRAGFALCTGATKAQAIQRAQEALACIGVDYV